MTSVFVRPEQFRGRRLFVTGADAHHLLRVLRLGPGDRFIALDGRGNEYRARILLVHHGGLEAEIEEEGLRRSEPRLRLTLGQALPKGEKMEEVIRKGTELGMAAFWPVLTERCVAVPPSERREDRLARWRRIATEAARQSGRAVIPSVAPIRTWAEILAEFPRFDLVLLPWEGDGTVALKEVLRGKESPVEVLALIGPEGGFSSSEVARAVAAGAKTLSLGPRILRTETAGLVLGAAVFYHYDEMGGTEGERTHPVPFVEGGAGNRL
ncbi:MAG: 16S rRNA (uracil(1498)-N(3))-methyltransferase [Firmicutes bacterium]|nr:16S rRNA (uracil(1498)-N(3))-methyltransferase [Bacillota bacterium]